MSNVYKTCRLIPTPTGWAWAPDNRIDVPTGSECQCVFAVAFDHTVPNHWSKWLSIGRDPGEIPNAVHRAILHLDRKAGTEADVQSLTLWAKKELKVRIAPVGGLPDGVVFTAGFEDRLFAEGA